MIRAALLAGMLALTACGSPSDETLDWNENVNAVEAPPAPDANIAAPALNPPAPPPPAQEPVTAPYKAVGTEPGWALTIADGKLDYIGDYGEVRINERRPDPAVTPSSETYRTPRLIVTVTRAPGCSDGMSDYRYADRVEVVADGKKVSGCGGERTLPEGASRP